MDDLIKLRDKIENLQKEKHIDIFKIFKDKDIPFSENKNGIFINLTNIPNNVIEEVKKHIHYLENQENMINEMEIQKNEYKKSFFKDT